MRDRCSGAASGNTKRSENGPASGSVWRRRAMPWFSSRPPGRSAPRRGGARRSRCSRCRRARPCRCWRRRRIPRARAGRGSRRRGSRRGPRRPAAAARSRASAACGSDSVMPVTWTPCSRAAWIAKLPQPQPTSSTRSPGSSASFAADQLELRLLRLLERLGAAREDRARVRHRLVEEQGEELVRHVVVVADGAPVARVAVAAPAGAQLGGRRARERAQRSRLGPPRRRGAAGRARPPEAPASCPAAPARRRCRRPPRRRSRTRARRRAGRAPAACAQAPAAT